MIGVSYQKFEVFANIELVQYPKDLTPKTVAQLLEDVALVYEIRGEDYFRIKAYENAALGIRQTDKDLNELWQKKKLQDIPGVGANIAQHLVELFETGRVKHFDQLSKGIPEGVFALANLSGIGAKTAYKLAKRFKLNDPQTAVQQLKKHVQAKEISQLPGFGSESEQNISESISEYNRRSKKRLLLIEAQNYANKLIAYMKENKACLRIEPLGSLRRQLPTIGDLDLAVASSEPLTCIKHFVSYPGVKKILAKGANTARILIKDEVQVDLKVVVPEVFGSLLQHFTGSKQHNILLREYALKKGYSLSEYGIKKLKNKNEKLKKFKDEESFYKYLNLAWIPPELREGTEEIEKAASNGLPKLVNLKDIKGDLHVHSNIDIMTSHDQGESSLEELAKAAQRLKYDYLGISDHNPKTSGISDKKILAVLKRRKEIIDKFNSSNENNVKKRKQKVFLFHSLEVDIKPDGSLALPDQAFELFDFLIVSIHASFRQNRRKITQRLLKALDYPKVKILGHPTGRMLSKREGYQVDWDKIFAVCRQKNIFLEINAWPQRLDLPDHLVKEGLKAGVKYIINSDSHSADHLPLMSYGVNVARRGWAEKKDIVNTLPLGKIKGIMKS